MEWLPLTFESSPLVVAIIYNSALLLDRIVISWLQHGRVCGLQTRLLSSTCGRLHGFRFCLLHGFCQLHHTAWRFRLKMHWVETFFTGYLCPVRIARHGVACILFRVLLEPIAMLIVVRQRRHLKTSETPLILGQVSLLSTAVFAPIAPNTFCSWSIDRFGACAQMPKEHVRFYLHHVIIVSIPCWNQWSSTDTIWCK